VKQENGMDAEVIKATLRVNEVIHMSKSPPGSSMVRHGCKTYSRRPTFILIQGGKA